MKEEGLKDESELQSHMIARIEKHLNDKGREIIGWDEILDGGLPPMQPSSWRVRRVALPPPAWGITPS